MNRFFVIFMLLIIIATSGAGAYACFIYIPHKVERNVIGAINSFGFENPVFLSIEHAKNEIILQDISLDTARLNTIETLRIRYCVFAFLTNPNKAQDIIITGLRLSGKTSKNFAVDIDALTDDARIVSNLKNFPAKNIYIESAVLDLLSEEMGKINIKGKGAFIIDKKGKITLNAKTKLAAMQEKLAFNALLEASISRKEKINFKAQLSLISVDFPNMNIENGFGRIAGNYSYKNPSPVTKLVGDMQFSSLRWRNLPLKDVETSIDISDAYRRYDLKGNVRDLENIPWRARAIYTKENNLFNTNINISPDTLQDIQSFMGRNRQLAINAYLPEHLLDIASPIISIENFYSPSKNNVNGKVEVKFANSPFVINAKYRSNKRYPENIAGSIKMKKTIYNPDINSGKGVHFDISATGNFMIKNYYGKKLTVLWAANTIIHDGILTFGPLGIPKMRGVIFLGGSENEQKNRYHKLSFSLPLKESIKNEGELILNLDDGEAPILKQLNLKIYGGEIKTQDQLFKNGHIIEKNTLDVSNIDLKKLTTDARLAGIFMNGYMAGIIPFEIKDSTLHVTGGLLQNQDTGIIRLSKTMINGLFPDNTHHNALLREALENFHYEFFEIRLDGDLNDRVMMTINARGKNPKMKIKKPLDVNLQIETQISLLFNALIKE